MIRVTHAKLGLYVNAYPERPAHNVVLENVSIQARHSGSLNHCRDWTMRNLELKSDSQIKLKNCENVELPQLK